MSKNLRTYLIVGLFALQAVAVLLIIVLTGATTNRLLVEQMDQQMGTAGQAAVDNAEAVLQGADHSARLTQRIIGTDLADPSEATRLEQFLGSELDTNPLLAGIYWGAPDHSFVIVQRDDTHNRDGYHTKIIRDLEGHRVVTNIYRNEDFTETERGVDETDTFDPTTRPWYQLAEQSGGENVVWTPPYVFFTSKQTGVTGAVAVRGGGAGGELLGVVGVDIELRGLSDFLADNVDVSPHGVAVIADAKGVVIATRDPRTAVKERGGTLDRAGVDEIGSPALAEAYRVAAPHLATTTPGHSTSVAFDVDGQPYRAVFSAVQGHSDWFVTVVAPEQDYVGDIQRTQRINAVLAVAVGLGIVCLALPIVRLLVRRSERLVQRATTDPLTGLANRRHFEEELAAELARPASRAGPLAVAMLDLDHFKSINDTYGHGVGDEALIAVAQRLTEAVRGDDLVARLGGDEYAVLVRGLALDQATAVLERARQAIEATPVHAGTGDDQEGALVPVRVTIGVADLVAGARDPASMLRRADQALYVAKERGRNQVATIRDVDPSEAGTAVPSAPVGADAGTRLS